MKRNKLILILIFIMTCELYSQNNLPNYFKGPPGDDVFAPPTVQAFHKYNFTPENLYIGRINVSVPIYNIVSGDINIPISLTYNSSGIKVSEMASNVGLGWNINAGGSILKVVRDLDDDKIKTRSISEPDDTGDNAGSNYGMFLEMGYHRFYSPYFIGGDTDRTYYPPNFSGSQRQKIDSSPDFYHINAPGLSTKFYLKDINPNDLTSTFENRYFDGIFLNHSGIKLVNTIQRSSLSEPRFRDDINLDLEYYDINGVTFFNTNRLVFSSFEIINNNGLHYEFNNRDLSEVATYDVSRLQPEKRDFNITNWNLTKIKDDTNNKEVIFNYQEYFKHEKEDTKSVVSTFNLPNNEYDYHFVRYSNVNLNFGTYDIHFNEKNSIRYPKLNRLTKIQWDNGSVDFIYELTRLDDSEEKALTEIIVKNIHNQIIKHFVFNYNYFNSKEGCSEKECKRLKLISIDEMSNNIILRSHSFEYYYENPLPRRDSFQRDYLGYYNNNGFEWSSTSQDEIPPNPILHFYKNQGKNSILPFQRTNGTNYRIINGDYSLEPNTYSLSGLLKKVTYPTGGSSEFEYENHTFNFLGSEYISGGARIKKQTLNDARGNINEINYEYILENGNSSGYANRIPVFANLNKSSEINFNILISENYWKKYFTCYDKSKYSLELTDGSFIGYSRVIKRQTNNGYTAFTYTSPNEYPNLNETTGDPFNNNTFFLNNNSYPSLNIIDLDIRRGKILSEKLFDNSNLLLREENYFYQYTVFDTLNMFYLTTISGSPFLEGGGGTEFSHSSHFNVERNLMTKVVTNQYFHGINKTTTKEMTYDTELPFVKENKLIDGVDEIKELTYYPFDNEVVNNNFVSELINSNRLSNPIKQKRYLNNILISTNQLDYADFGNNVIAHKSKLTSKGNLPLEEEVIINIRDNKGNPIDVNKKDGQHIVYIWGYNKSLPIAKIANVTFNDISTYISDLQTKSNNDNDRTVDVISGGIISYQGNEGLLREALNNLRTVLPDAMVYTYTYDPLIGVTSITDPKGLVQYFYYDNFNRLQFIKDQEGNILKENSYNYRDVSSDGGGTTPPICTELLSGDITRQQIAIDNNIYSYSLTANIAGGSSNYSYDWTIIQNNGVTQNINSSNGNPSYVIDIDSCNLGSNPIKVICTVTDLDNSSTCNLGLQNVFSVLINCN